jgi:hypothetical protein
MPAGSNEVGTPSGELMPVWRGGSNEPAPLGGTVAGGADGRRRSAALACTQPGRAWPAVGAPAAGDRRRPPVPGAAVGVQGWDTARERLGFDAGQEIFRGGGSVLRVGDQADPVGHGCARGA